MAKRPMTVEVDESLVEATATEARQTGHSQAEVVEQALRTSRRGAVASSTRSGPVALLKR